MARNFYKEGMNPLRPRIDQRFDTDGVTGMQFPAYEYLVALGYELVGFHNYVHRVVSFLIYMLGAWGLYELFLILFANPWAAALGAWGFCWSPELFFFGISALPDVLALTGSVWGLTLFLRWFKGGGTLPYGLGLLAATVGGLAKIQYLVIGFPIAAVVLMGKRKYTGLKILEMTFFAVVSVGLTLGWYFYAVHLIRVSGLADYDIGFTPAPGFAWGARVVWHNAVSEIPELILNYATFIFAVAGVYVCFKEKKWRSEWFAPVAVWGMAVLAYYFIELGKMGVHSYYLLPFLPLLLILAVWGGLFLKDSKHAWLFLFLLLAQPTLAFFRIVPHRFWSDDKAVPLELYNAASRERLEKAVPDGQLCVVGPDASRTVYFYFLDKKGFGFGDTGELAALFNGQPLISDYIRRGARYLYTDDPGLPKSGVLRPYLGEEVLQEGAFRVFKLKLPQGPLPR